MLSLSTVLNMGWKSDATWKIRNIFENCSASLESSWLFYVLHCTLSRPAFALFKMSVLPRHLLTLELCQLDSLKLWVLGNWAPCDSAAVRRPRSASKWCIYRKVWCHFTSNGVPTADRQGEIRQAESQWSIAYVSSRDFTLEVFDFAKAFGYFCCDANVFVRIGFLVYSVAGLACYRLIGLILTHTMEVAATNLLTQQFCK